MRAFLAMAICALSSFSFGATWTCPPLNRTYNFPNDESANLDITSKYAIVTIDTALKDVGNVMWFTHDYDPAPTSLRDGTLDNKLLTADFMSNMCDRVKKIMSSDYNATYLDGGGVQYNDSTVEMLCLTRHSFAIMTKDGFYIPDFRYLPDSYFNNPIPQTNPYWFSSLSNSYKVVFGDDHQFSSGWNEGDTLSSMLGMGAYQNSWGRIKLFNNFYPISRNTFYAATTGGAFLPYPTYEVSAFHKIGRYSPFRTEVHERKYTHRELYKITVTTNSDYTATVEYESVRGTNIWEFVTNRQEQVECGVTNVVEAYADAEWYAIEVGCGGTWYDSGSNFTHEVSGVSYIPRLHIMGSRPASNFVAYVDLPYEVEYNIARVKLDPSIAHSTYPPERAPLTDNVRSILMVRTFSEGCGYNLEEVELDYENVLTQTGNKDTFGLSTNNWNTIHGEMNEVLEQSWRLTGTEPLIEFYDPSDATIEPSTTVRGTTFCLVEGENGDVAGWCTTSDYVFHPDPFFFDRTTPNTVHSVLKIPIWEDLHNSMCWDSLHSSLPWSLKITFICDLYGMWKFGNWIIPQY